MSDAREARMEGSGPRPGAVTYEQTDATGARMRGEGRCLVFVIVDHASSEVWDDGAKRMDRFAAA
jgi:hypothetical protein